MLIQCTKKLLDKIGIKESELATSEGREEFPNSFFTWHANMITMNRKKAIILMNNETRFPIVIYRPVKNDFLTIRTVIREAITEALRTEGVSQQVIDKYVGNVEDISFSKTANRSMTAKLNNTVREVEFMEEYIDYEANIQRYISLVASRLLQKFDGENDYHYPNEKMLECLKEMNGSDSVLDVERYQLKIKIELDGFDIWRRVLVPSTYSFRHLHRIIQTVFDWHNSHLHQFTVDRTDGKPLHIIMDDHPETRDYIDMEKFEVRQERFVSLKDVFSKTSDVSYVYDFGDWWDHVITLEKVERTNAFEASFLGGKGERPPEDVGGEWGFEEYIETMKNEMDPDHDEMKVWAEGQAEREQSTEQINRRLKKVIKGYSFSTYFI